MYSKEPDTNWKNGNKIQNGIQDRKPSPEQVDVVLIEEFVLLQAQDYVRACERCDATSTITFDYLLDELSGCDPARTEYLMRRPVKCMRCDGQITEKTLIVA